MKIKTIGLAALLLAGASLAQAQSFEVSDIRVEGLQRVSAASVFNAFPVSARDRVDDRDLAEATRRLFATGLFEDIQLARDGDVLIIQVVERPTITRLNITGNRRIGDDELRQGLEEAGLAEGQVLQLSTLEEIQRELEGLYQGQGRYSATTSFTDELEPGVTSVTYGQSSVRLAPLKGGGRDLPEAGDRIVDLGEGATPLKYIRGNVLATDKALYKGHAIAAVAAVNRHVAEEALSLIEVQYEALPCVLTAPDAMRQDAPLLHDDLETEEFGQKTGRVSNIHMNKNSDNEPSILYTWLTIEMLAPSDIVKKTEVLSRQIAFCDRLTSAYQQSSWAPSIGSNAIDSFGTFGSSSQL